MNMFTPVPDVLRKLCILPPWGGWCMLTGNPLAPRGQKMPAFCGELGLRRMDVIWMENEQMPSNSLARAAGYTERAPTRRRRGQRSVDDSVAALTKESFVEEVDKMDRDELIELLYGESPFAADRTGLQVTILDARLGMNQTVRFWNGELNPIPEERIQYYLQENALVAQPFAMPGEKPPAHPLIEEPLRDMIGALELDGLSHAEALAEVMKWGGTTKEQNDALKTTVVIPNYWYRTADEVYYTFND
jgi:hypothetical protein